LDWIIKLLSNQYFSISLSLIGLFLASLGIFISRKHRKVKIFGLNKWENDEVISLPLKDKDDIKILYKDKKIDNLYELKITLKNYGTEVLNEKNFDTLPYITFNEKVQILNVSVSSKEEYIKPKFEIINNEVIVRFNFIEPKDTISIKILYSSNSVCGGQIKGKVIGGNKIENIFKSEIEYQAFREGKSIGKFVYMLFAGFCLIIIKKITSILNINPPFNTITVTIGIIISILFSLIIGKFVQYKLYKRRLNIFISQGKINDKKI